jgi:hypothetical protein
VRKGPKPKLLLMMRLVPTIRMDGGARDAGEGYLGSRQRLWWYCPVWSSHTHTCCRL